MLVNEVTRGDEEGLERDAKYGFLSQVGAEIAMKVECKCDQIGGVSYSHQFSFR